MEWVQKKIEKKNPNASFQKFKNKIQIKSKYEVIFFMCIKTGYNGCLDRIYEELFLVNIRQQKFWFGIVNF